MPNASPPLSRSYQIVSWGRPLQLRRTPIPVPEGEQVLLRVEACGVCHSDVHIREGSFDLGQGRKVFMADQGLALPFTMGHEIVGRVVAAGPQAKGVNIGMRAVVYPWISCDACVHCRDGRHIDCERKQTLGTRLAGGFSDHVLVPHGRFVIDIGDIDPLVAATCACSGLAAYGALSKLPPLHPEDVVLVIGAGGLGLAALGMAEALVGARMLAADVDDGKLATATTLGAWRTANTRGDGAAQRVIDAAGGKPRAVIDFVGTSQTAQLAIDVVGSGGTVIIVGLGGGSLSLPLPLIPGKNLTIRGSNVGSLAQFRALLALVADKRVRTVPIATRPMAEVDSVLDALRDGTVVGRIVTLSGEENRV